MTEEMMLDVTRRDDEPPSEETKRAIAEAKTIEMQWDAPLLRVEILDQDRGERVVFEGVDASGGWLRLVRSGGEWVAQVEARKPAASEGA